MRMLGPFVILSTLGVFFTGLLLLIDGPGAPSILRLLHKLSFFAWLAVVGVHVLGSSHRDARGVAGRQSRRATPPQPPGSRGRGVAVFAALAGGLVLALLVPARDPQLDRRAGSTTSATSDSTKLNSTDANPRPDNP